MSPLNMVIFVAGNKDTVIECITTDNIRVKPCDTFQAGKDQHGWVRQRHEKLGDLQTSVVN